MVVGSLGPCSKRSRRRGTRRVGALPLLRRVSRGACRGGEIALGGAGACAAPVAEPIAFVVDDGIEAARLKVAGGRQAARTCADHHDPSSLAFHGFLLPNRFG